MTTTMKQIKNEKGNFSYLLNDKIYIQNSKHDYSYFLIEVGSFSKSLKSIESVKRFWLKHGGENVNKENLIIIEILK